MDKTFIIQTKLGVELLTPQNQGWIEEIDPDNFSNYDHYWVGVQEIFGERGGFAVPTGAGKRVIILPIGNEKGFLNGAMDCFIGDEKDEDDYHKKMNAYHFSQWFKKRLTILPPKSVIVLDQALYHTMLNPEYRNPTSGWKKQQIVDWLIKRAVPVPLDVLEFNELTKVELLGLSKDHRFEKKYILDKILKEIRPDCELFWLPVAHYEFNPIELVWAYVKNTVAKQNTTFKTTDVKKLCIDTMNSIPDSLWPNSLKHVIEHEALFRKSTSIADSIQPVINKLETDSETESDITDSDDIESSDESF